MPGASSADAVVEADAVLEDQPHHADHVVDLVAVIEAAVAHVAAGREAHLGILEMEPRGGEIEERADVVVVHVGDDDVLHGRGLDAEQGQALARASAGRCACAAAPSSSLKPVSTTKVRSALRISQTK